MIRNYNSIWQNRWLRESIRIDDNRPRACYASAIRYRLDRFVIAKKHWLIFRMSDSHANKTVAICLIVLRYIIGFRKPLKSVNRTRSRVSDKLRIRVLIYFNSPNTWIVEMNRYNRTHVSFTKRKYMVIKRSATQLISAI